MKKNLYLPTDKKVLWFDTETTGVDPQKNAIVQLSGMILINDEIMESFDIKMQPWNGAEINPKAMEVHGLTEEDLETFQSHEDGIAEFKRIVHKYVSKFDRNDKFVLAGYNVNFDDGMLRTSFRKCHDIYYGSLFAFPKIDAVTYVAEHFANGLRLKNNKLSTLCEHFNIEIKAHDAMSDIQATRELYLKLKDEQDKA